MEIGIENDIPTYSGGLGVLAGDTIRSAADLRVPMVAVTLVSRKGYLKQKITDNGEQLEFTDEWEPSKMLNLMGKTTNVRIEGRDVKVQAWIYAYQSENGGMVPILFLDTDTEHNFPEDRRITDHLYGGNEEYRFKQEIVLGIGGARLLKELFFTVKKYHMNEGHSSLLTLELLKQNDMEADIVRNQCVFTTHTPIKAAFDKFSYDLFQKLLDDEFPLPVLKQYAGQEVLNMTELGSNLSKYINGVSEAHMECSKKLFPGHYLRSINNGIHSYTWTSPYLKTLFDKYIPGWCNEPIRLVKGSEIPNEELWIAHEKAKRTLIQLIQQRNNIELDLDSLTIGFARRTTGYKRATLIFSNLDRLRDINKNRELQLIFAGKAHPKDYGGKRLIKEIYAHISNLKNEMKLTYLENYDMDLAKKLISGVEVWLNTPLIPMEASGTSGMKAAHNGVVNFSVLDGWWKEGCIEGVTGWSIGPQPNEPMKETERTKREINDLYNKLEYLILPKFCNKRDEWIIMMKNSITKLAYYFQSHWMIQRYLTDAYI